MRINAGSHRGAKLTVPKGESVRPTSDKARQAIFNILTHGTDRVRGSRVLDAFAGSGALGLEALSRGAASLVAFDTDKSALAAIRQNVAHCKEARATRIVMADATNPPPAGMYPGHAPCGLIFLDPPYGLGIVPKTLRALNRAGWIAEGCLIVAELGAGDALEVPCGFEILDTRRYGKAQVIFLSARLPT